MIFNKEYWGKGFGTEALRVLIGEFAFKTLNLHLIELEVLSSNSRAYKCYEKAGFKEVGRWREAHFVNGEYVDGIIMDILRSEWIKENQG